MPAFCPNCGTSIPAGTAFCPGCGTKIEQQAAPEAPKPAPSANPFAPKQPAPANPFAPQQGAAAPKPSQPDFSSYQQPSAVPAANNVVAGTRKVPVLTIFLVILLLGAIGWGVYLIVSGGSGSSKSSKSEKGMDAEDIVTNYCKAMTDADVELYNKLLSDAMYDGLAEDAEKNDMDVDEAISDQLKKAGKGFTSSVGDNYEMTAEILKSEELSESKLKAEKKRYKNNIDADVEVEEGVNFQVEFKVTGDDDEITRKSSFEVYKIDGKWCLGFNNL